MILISNGIVFGTKSNLLNVHNLCLCRRVVRNFFLGPQPELLQAKYPACSEKYLSEKVTIVVSVKDSCSQAPGFLEGLEKIVSIF